MEDTNTYEGFRLHSLEVYNWGTFNQHVWKIEPSGSTALLTGKNGSGKSTLVDALLTLLVPNQRRSYNQASGTERRRERDEKSYVRGAYGRIKDEDNRGVVQYLRDKTSYSVVLACFSNQRLAQTISIAHIFYWKEDELRKLYVVAPQHLHIADDLRVTTTVDELRKRLRASGADVFEEFSRYSRQLIKLFRLRSDKALDLFNQTVSIKEIGGLNEFVRQHMLEKTDTSEKIAQLRETYQNLTRAHDAIAKAEEQLARLGPLLQEADQYNTIQTRIADAERYALAVPHHFARHKLELLRRAIISAQAERAEQHSRASALKIQLEDLRQREINLTVAINADSVGQQLIQFRKDAEHIRERRRDKKQRAERYNGITRSLNLAPYSDDNNFFANARQAKSALAPLEQRLQTLIHQRDEHKQEEGRLIGICQNLHNELASLRQRKSRIPSDDLRIRERLAQALGVAEEELPFVGELLKVRDNARAWEGAIERLLRGYGRTMLVPEEHYRQVTGYAESTNLRGRLVFLRADSRRTPRGITAESDALVGKLEIKPDAALHYWLKSDLLEHWDYICCATVEQFQRERRALTQGGQIKSGGARHEKDDRFDLNDRTRYVLGWDNRETIAALEVHLANEQTALATVQTAISTLEKEQRQRSDQRQRLNDLLAFDDFQAINWQADEQQLSEIEQRIRELEASSDQLAQLQQQLNALQAQRAATEADSDRVRTIIATFDSDLRRYEQQQTTSMARLHNVPPISEADSARIEADSKSRSITLATIDEVQNQLERFYSQSAASLRGQTNALERGMIEKMVNFKRDYPEDTTDMDASIEAIGEFQRMHERITRDDLPTHRKRFKDWLDSKVVDAIVGFQSMLDKKVAEYRESIATLNESLRTIAYTPATYIQLTADPNREAEVQEFRRTLRSCIPDVGQRTPEANEASFQRIRALINRFEKEERWTNKVTDVRNWLDFAAEEIYNEDSIIKNYYSDSSGKSGGQKAKLAYTILASAIAYQYGLAQNDDQARTFRFVVVDEAFSKSDETNARYAMDLFKQLHLQLLVVTPLDKTHVVEPYIAACHFVTNNQDENDSRVINMSIAQYEEQKAHFNALAASVD